jgi:sugar-specific transcriptional regulator TrmB
MAASPRPEQTLAALGFTEMEASVYCELLRAPASTGYRLAQSTGKAAANVYQALAALTQKGAVFVDDSEAKTYRAVPPAELIAALAKNFQARAQEAKTELEALHEPEPDDRLYQLSTVEQVFERAAAMIDRAREILLFDLFPEPYRRLEPHLTRAARRGLTVAGSVYAEVAPTPFPTVRPAEAKFIMQRWPGLQIGVVADAREHLLALLTPDARVVKHGVWSDSVYLGCLEHSARAAELRAAASSPAERKAAAQLTLTRAYPPGLRSLIGPRKSGGRTAA